jgi:tRNA(Ile)-lysidine synthase TilS/MesJ
MKIIITENQNYILRRVLQFIEISEEIIEDYELQGSNAWWCDRYNPDSFFRGVMRQAIEEFMDKNWNFFHDESENGGANMDTSILNNIFKENYWNYVRNIYVKQCDQPRW